MTDFQEFIGRQYDHEKYNCWHFFCDIQQEFGLNLPDIPISGHNLRGATRAFSRHGLRGSWQQISAPCHGCGVLMGKGRFATHVGCWLTIDGGGVMHNTDRPGVVFSSPQALAQMGWKIFGYYRYIGGRDAECH